jgi:hypothetical protein
MLLKYCISAAAARERKPRRVQGVLLMNEFVLSPSFAFTKTIRVALLEVLADEHSIVTMGNFSSI